jgi:hypothetical protein
MRKRFKECLVAHELQAGEHCFFCGKKINPSFQERIKEACSKVPQEIKQKFLDLIHNGKTIGEAREQAGLSDQDLLVACEILNENIATIKYLKTTAV